MVVDFVSTYTGGDIYQGEEYESIGKSSQQPVRAGDVNIW